MRDPIHQVGLLLREFGSHTTRSLTMARTMQTATRRKKKPLWSDPRKLEAKARKREKARLEAALAARRAAADAPQEQVGAPAADADPRRAADPTRGGTEAAGAAGSEVGVGGAGSEAAGSGAGAGPLASGRSSAAAARQPAARRGGKRRGGARAPPPAAPAPALPAAPDVKLEALSAAERAYWELQRLPFDAGELAALRAHYLEPYMAARSGGLRVLARPRRCAPRARQYYTERLWRALEGLAAAADRDGGGDDAAAAAAPGGERPPARAELLFWLRVLRRFDGACHREAPPLLLQRAAGGGDEGGDEGDDEGGGGRVEEVIDLTGDDEEGEAYAAADVEALLLQRGWAVVRERSGGGRAAAAPARVKRERQE
jgi:hypothetical protein